ncbi:MAG TPA: helix-turn-helix transcriptional regulator [Xanthobacteraceae bacterium]|nr:helix-turn-helix transcriptional regulator [Xanthobacteraceae bacterium]
MNEEVFLKEDLISLRRDLGLTQQEMAEHLGMALRSYQDIEAGVSKYRFIHRLAAERVALAVAVDRMKPELVPQALRDDAVELVRLGQLTRNPAFAIDSGAKTTAQKVGERERNAKFEAAYGVVGELILITTALDYQLTHIVIQVLHLTESPMLESVIATLDMVRKIEMLKARSKYIHQPKWRKSVHSHLEKLERILKWRNIAAHTALIPDEEHGAVFAPAAAAKLLKSLQITEDAIVNRTPIGDLKLIIKLAESALYDGEVILQNFRKVNTEWKKRFGKLEMK